MNKKGVSMTGWTEGILLSVLLVAVLGIVISGMNTMYSENHQVGLGVNTTQNAFADYQGTLESEISGGEADFTGASGMTLKSSWGIVKSGMDIIWAFMTGGWIETITTDYMKLPEEVGVYVRILYFLSLGFIILKILFKVKP